MQMRISTSTGGFLRDLVAHALQFSGSGLTEAVSDMAPSKAHLDTSSHDFTLTLSGFDVRAFWDAHMSIDLQRLADLSVVQIVNLQCWQEIMEDVGLFFGMSVGSLSVKMDCGPGDCECNAYAAEAATNAAACAAAGSCVWSEGVCKPNWLTSLKTLWDGDDTSRRLANAMEGLVGSFSGLLNAAVLAAPMEIMNIRRYATDLYSIFGADSVASPRSIEERNELLMQVEDATRERISREHPHAKLSNLNDNDLVQYVQGKLTNLTALVRNAVPSNYTMVIGRSIPTPFQHQFDGETWIRELNDGEFDGIEQQESQEWVVESIALTGLDSLQEIKLFQSTQGNLTWLHKAGIDEIGISLNMTVRTMRRKPPDSWRAWWSCVDDESSSTTSTVVVTTRLTNIAVEFASLLAVDLDALYNTPLGQLLQQPVGCLASAVKDLSMTYVDVTLGDDCLLEPEFEVSGDALPPVTAKLANLLRVSEALLEPLMQAHLSDVLNAVLPSIMSDGISEQLAAISDCPHAPQVPFSTIDFTTNPSFLQIRDLLQTIPVSDINADLGAWAEEKSTQHVACPDELTGVQLDGNCTGVYIAMREDVPGEGVFNVTTGGFDLQISDVVFQGIDSLSLDILKPLDSYKLNTTIAVGPVRLSAHVVSVVGKGPSVPTIYNEFDLSFGAPLIQFIVGLVLEIDTHDLWGLTPNELNLEECWLGILNEGDLYELALKLGLDMHDQLDLRLECKSETHQPACKEGGLVDRIATSLNRADSGTRLGTAFNRIFSGMTDSVVTGTGFNLPDQACNELGGNMSIILEDLTGEQALESTGEEVPTKSYAAEYERTFSVDPLRGGSPDANLIDLRCDGCNITNMKSGAAGLVQYLVGQVQAEVGASLIDRINRTIEAATGNFEYLHTFEPPIVLRDTTGSLPEAVAAGSPFWIREAGEIWQLTGIALRELRSMQTASLAEPLGYGTQYTLWNELSMGRMEVDLHLSVSTVTKAAPHTCVGSDVEVDTVVLSFGVADLHFGIATMLAIDEHKLSELQTGQLFNASLGCLLSTVNSFEFTAANLSVGSFSKPTMEKDFHFGKLEHPTLDLIGPTVCIAQPLLNRIASLAIGPENGGINLRVVVNGLIRERMAELASACEPMPTDAPYMFDPYLNFQTAEVKVPVVNEVVNIMDEVSRLLNETISPAELNKLLADKFPGGRWEYRREASQVDADLDSTFCSMPCDVEELPLCWGRWNDHPDTENCPATPLYDPNLYDGTCGHSCSTDPHRAVDVFLRPQNSTVSDDIGVDLGSLGEVKFEVSNITITGLDKAVDELLLLNITDKYTISNTARLFRHDPLQLSFDVRLGVTGLKESANSTEWPPTGLDSDFTVTFSAQDISFAFAFILQLRDSLRSLAFVDLFNANCAIRVIEDMLPTTARLNISSVGIDVVCRKCTPKLLEWEARTKVQNNLVELTDTLNTHLGTLAEGIEVKHDEAGALMHAPSDRAESDAQMRMVYSTLLEGRQGYEDDRFTVSDRDVCAGLVHRESALERLNSTRQCGVLEILNSDYNPRSTFDLLDEDTNPGPPPDCSGTGQQCTYTCDDKYHIQGENVLKSEGVVTCLETGEYTGIVPCVLVSETTVEWWRHASGESGTEVLVIVGIAVAACITGGCARKRRVQRYRKVEDEQADKMRRSLSLPTSPTRQSGKLSDKGDEIGHLSLLRNENLLHITRVFLPVLLFVNFIFFIFGHLYPMMSIDVILKLFGREIKIDIPAMGPLMETLAISRSNGISLGEVIMLLIRSPETPWVVIIAVMGLSGAWPYSKLGLLLSAWILPPSRLGPKKRGQWIMLINASGKLQFIYLYISVFVMLAFRITVKSPEIGVLPAQLWHVDLRLTAGYGLFAFTIAAVMSLLLNNIALHYHRNALSREFTAILMESQQEPDSKDDLRGGPENANSGGAGGKDYEALGSVDDSTEIYKPTLADKKVSWYDTGTDDVHGIRKSLVYSREALRNHVFILSKFEVWFPIGGQAAVVLVLLGTMVCTIIGGFWLNCIGVRVKGVGAAVGTAVGAAFGSPDSIDVNYSVMTSFLALMEHHENDSTIDHIRVTVLGLVYVSFGIIVPLLQQVVLLVLWTLPLTLQWNKRLFSAAEVLQSLNALPVLVAAYAVTQKTLAIIASSTHKTVGAELCSSLRTVGVITAEDENAGLFQVLLADQFVENPGIYLLLAASIAEYVVGTVVLRCAEVAIVEREWRISGRPPDEEQCMGFGKPIMNKLLQGTTCCLIPVTPGLRFMPRFFVRRYNLSKLLLQHGNDDDTLGAADRAELSRRTAWLNPILGVEKAPLAETAELRARMMRHTGSAENDADAAARGGPSKQTLDTWAAAGNLEAAHNRSWSCCRSAASSNQASLPLGWTKTMWRGEVVYWNTITGQTTLASPKERQIFTEGIDLSTLSPQEKWRAAAEEAIGAPLDLALVARVWAREETALDESLPFEFEQQQQDSDGSGSGGEEERPRHRLALRPNAAAGAAETGLELVPEDEEGELDDRTRMLSSQDRESEAVPERRRVVRATRPSGNNTFGRQSAEVGATTQWRGIKTMGSL